MVNERVKKMMILVPEKKMILMLEKEMMMLVLERQRQHACRKPSKCCFNVVEVLREAQASAELCSC